MVRRLYRLRLQAARAAKMSGRKRERRCEGGMHKQYMELDSLRFKHSENRCFARAVHLEKAVRGSRYSMQKHATVCSSNPGSCAKYDAFTL